MTFFGEAKNGANEVTRGEEPKKNAPPEHDDGDDGDDDAKEGEEEEAKEEAEEEARLFEKVVFEIMIGTPSNDGET